MARALTGIRNVMLITAICAAGCARPPTHLPVQAPTARLDVEDVQLLVSMTDPVFAADSAINLSLQLKNSSSNTIYLAPANPGEPMRQAGWKVLLINPEGRTYELLHFPSAELVLKPGETQKWMDVAIVHPLRNPRHIPRGDYRLLVTESVRRVGSDVVFDIGSNLLEVRVTDVSGPIVFNGAGNMRVCGV